MEHLVRFGAASQIALACPQHGLLVVTSLTAQQ